MFETTAHTLPNQYRASNYLTTNLPTSPIITASLDEDVVLCSLQRIDSAENPLDITIGNAWLELRLHVARLERLHEHEPSLVVLNTNDSLWSIPANGAVFGKHGCVLKIRQSDVDGSCRRSLETKLSVPGHVLDS